MDVLKNAEIIPKLDKFRSAAKALKAVKYKGIHINNNIRSPVLDVPTRWGSTYLMMEVMLKNKHVYELEELSLTDDDWAFGKVYLEAFKPMFVLTKNLQEQNMVLGDLFKFYLETELQNNKLSSDNMFKQILITAINVRKTKLFDCTAFRAGLFFDPRWTYRASKFFPMDHLESTIVS